MANGYVGMDPYFDDDIKRDDPETAEWIAGQQKLWQEYTAAGNTEAANAIHENVDRVRREKFGYTTNPDGTGYIKVQTNAQTPPTSTYNPYIEAEEKANSLLASQKEAQIKQTNQSFDKSNQNAYIQREQQKLNLPTQLAAYGITGGMAETTAARIGTAYGNQVNSNEQARASAINNINMAADQQALQMAIDFADKKIAQSNWQTQFDRNVYESDRNFGWNAYTYNKDFNFNKGQADIDNAYRQNAYEDSLKQQGIDNEYRQNVYNDSKYQSDMEAALVQASYTGDYSPMLKYGWSQEAVNRANANAYAQAQAAAKKSSGSGSGGKKSDDKEGKVKYSTAEIALAQQKLEEGILEDWIFDALEGKYPHMTREQMIAEFAPEGTRDPSIGAAEATPEQINSINTMGGQKSDAYYDIARAVRRMTERPDQYTGDQIADYVADCLEKGLLTKSEVEALQKNYGFDF